MTKEEIQKKYEDTQLKMTWFNKSKYDELLNKGKFVTLVVDCDTGVGLYITPNFKNKPIPLVITGDGKINGFFGKDIIAKMQFAFKKIPAMKILDKLTNGKDSWENKPPTKEWEFQLMNAIMISKFNDSNITGLEMKTVNG